MNTKEGQQSKTNSLRNASEKTRLIDQCLSDQDDREASKSATGFYRFGAVASDRAECSRVGKDILANHGGSTIDAAIATLLCLGVMHFPVTGIGGGFFMTIHDSKKKEVITLCSREMAPLSAASELYANKKRTPAEGALSIAVPGQIAGYAEAHKRYGKLPWSQLFEPAIRLCEEGFVVNEFLQYVIETNKESIESHPKLRTLLTKSDGTLVKEGDVIRRPTYARTLRRIAEEGPSTFYNGSLANDIVEDIKDEGGVITLEDLQNYTAPWKKPVKVTLSNGDYTLYGPPPPSSAAVMFYILNIMNGYDVKPSDIRTTDSRVLLTHRLVEAMKFGFGKSSFLGDEALSDISEWLDRLQSDSYAEETRFKIIDNKVLPFEDYESAYESVTDGGTTHLSVYGPDGISVSVTSSINNYFGSKVIGQRTGIFFNNEMDNFSSPDVATSSPNNHIAPGKRPVSSMSPTIVLDKDGNMVLTIGSSGSQRIISGTLLVIMNTLWLGYDVTEALDQPRYHNQLLPNIVLHEISWPLDIQRGLELKGHKFKIKEHNFCVTQVIKDDRRKKSPEGAKDACYLQAASDVRRLGAPDGY